MVCAFVNMVGLYTGGLIFGWAYIWNDVSVIVIWWANAREAYIRDGL